VPASTSSPIVPCLDRLFGREVAAGADRAPVAGVDRLDGVRGADDPPDLHVVEAVAESRVAQAALAVVAGMMSCG